MKRFKPRRVTRTLGTLAVLVWAAPAMGAVLVWSGGGFDGDWTTTSNWSSALTGPVEGDDVVLDDTMPRRISVVDADVIDPGSDGFDIKTLYIGDGMTLDVTGHPLDVNVSVTISGMVTINCGFVLEGCDDTVIRIGGGEATVLTKTGNACLLIGIGVCE